MFCSQHQFIKTMLNWLCLLRCSGAGGHHSHSYSRLPGSVCPPGPHRHHTEEVYRLLERIHLTVCVYECAYVFVWLVWVCVCSAFHLILSNLNSPPRKMSRASRFAVDAENCGRSLNWLFTDLLVWTLELLLNISTCQRRINVRNWLALPVRSLRVIWVLLTLCYLCF